jgi:diguanylate cyclase (GGDEF)-like protein
MGKKKNFFLMIGGTVVISYILPLAVIIVTNKYLADWFWIGESFHAFIEGIGAFSAIMLTILFLMSKLDKKTAYQLWISCALLGMGILDGFHASVPPGEISIWLRSTSTLIGGFLFALVWLPVRPLFIKSPEILIWFVLIMASIFDGYSVLFPASLPIMSISGDFTFTAKMINFIGGILFLIASVYFVVRYHSTKKGEDLLFVNLTLLFGIAGLLFHMSSTWNAGWWFWHFLRLMAYFHILGYVFTLYQKRKEALEKAHDELELRVKDRTAALMNTNQKLQASELRLRKIITSNADSMIIISKNGIVSFVNPAAKNLFDKKSEEFIGTKFEFPIQPNQSTEIEIKKKNEEKAIAEMRVVQIEWAGKIAYLASCRDVTEIVHLREKLKAMSLIDELTKLYNRRGFHELSKQQLKIAHRLKNVVLLIFVDLDNMKSINDKFGHKAGDQALIDTANILKATFRKSDIIGRMGGDEFAILAIEASKANIDTINRRLHEFIDIHNKKANRPFELSMSIGISRFYPDSQQTLDDLITQADEQMYLQKRRKKGLQTENIKMESK